jgi:hypothetical protein
MLSPFSIAFGVEFGIELFLADISKNANAVENITNSI